MKLTALLALLCAIGLWGCSKNPAQSAQGEIKMYLVDNPAEFDAVNIVVTEVSVHQADTDSMSGWTVINNTTRTFNLLTLANGASTVLGDTQLNPGHYTQLRLKIGSGSTVVVNGQTYPLDVPSGSQSGIKLNHSFDIAANTLYELTLDFDASRSIHVTGNNQYKLSPVIRVAANVTSGAISGVVNPASAKAMVSTLAGTDTVSTAADSISGAFKLMALPAGTYAVKITPSTSAYRDTTLTGVQVVARQESNVGTITLHP